MVNHILELDYQSSPDLVNLFQTMADGNSILFLGAGASVTEKDKFLSSDVIEFYEDNKRISWGISDIIEFVDVLTNNPAYRREEFDNYVDTLLRRLRPNSSHLSIAKSSWRMIITTNFDLLIEQAFAQVENTANQNGRLKIVYNASGFHSVPANDEIKYVKLHGCISNKKEHKLVFSSEDFKKAEKYYKRVLSELRNISDRVSFISIGYSYTDLFAKKLLDKIDSYNFRNMRVLYNIDPYINVNSLPLYSEKRICVIKATMEDFFQKFEQWKLEKDVVIAKSKKIYFTNNENASVYIPAAITNRIGDNLKQLNLQYSSRIIPEIDFYKGEEPDFSIILRNYDVVKKEKEREIYDEILKVMKDPDPSSRLIPIFFLTGTFGTGKSTFAYRLINNLNSFSEPTVSFQLYDPSAISAFDLKEVITRTGAQNVLLYIDTIEIDSIFKAVLDLRHKLSLELTPDIKVGFVATVRENIYFKLKQEKQIKNSFSHNIDCRFSTEEIEELVIKLKNSGAISYRDIVEKNEIVNRISHEFAGDSYVSLIELVRGNKLAEDLQEAYHRMNNETKKAFVYTSLLYQYKILMPAGLLCSLVIGNSDWQKFRETVIDQDGRGILIQEIFNSKGTDPDLYFRTRHSVISEKLISLQLSNSDSKFGEIKKIITHIISGSKNSELIINFLKALSENNHLSQNHINYLFDQASENLNNDIHFLIHYSINLQHRHTTTDIRKAIALIINVESENDLFTRNHFLVHRRGVLSFELARLLYSQKSGDDYKIYQLIEEARDFLEIKRTLDPFSSFSYTDLLKLEIWTLEHFDDLNEDKLKRRIHIEELFEQALRVVNEYVNKIYDIKSLFIKRHKFNGSEREYVEYLQEYYSHHESRPYALVLLFNFYLDKNDIEICESYLPELESIPLNLEVAKLLLKFYGRSLYSQSYRFKFFDLLKLNPGLQDVEKLRYYYFSFIAECYNKNFTHAHGFLQIIKREYFHINTDQNQVWIDPETMQPAIFEAVLRINNFGRKQLYVYSLHLWVRSENWDKDWQKDMKFDVEIYFYIYGLRAKAINQILDEYEDEPEGNLDIVNEL